MEYRRLGNSGLKVSAICLGAMMFGDRTNEEVAMRIAASALVPPGHTSTAGYTDPNSRSWAASHGST